MKQKINIKFLLLFVLFIFFIRCQSPKTFTTQSTITPKANDVDTKRGDVSASGSQYAISTQGKYATQASNKIFKLGGNAIDAALAASFVLAVERPHSTGIGGGGFMIYHEAKTQKNYAIDFRERAPLKSFAKMFIDKNNKPDALLSINGILAPGVPGLVAGLLTIHKKFGKISLSKIMEPAISLAKNGFPIYKSLAEALKAKSEILSKDEAASKIFLDKNLNPLPLGHILIQKDLALTLTRIAKFGSDEFYKGETSKKIIQFFKKKNGLLSSDDLKKYKVIWREPIIGQFKNFEIVSMPPPSSGGIHVIQFLNMLENDHLKNQGMLSENSIHLASQALQSAFSDRAYYLGDPDFVEVPIAKLISKSYAKKRRAEFNESLARKTSDVSYGNFDQVNLLNNLHEEHTETTHLSIMAKNGDTVSTTQTINGKMGASLVVPGTGIVLNNEMDDFSAQVGASNLFGAIGSEANAIAPFKTPLSSMSPTIVLQMKNNVKKSIMAVGAPGGTRIISCVAQTLLNKLEFELPLYDSIASVRYHHQWKPDILDIENPGPMPEVLQGLKKRGHIINLNTIPCNVMAVSLEGEIFNATADPRDIGTALAE